MAELRQVRWTRPLQVPRLKGRGATRRYLPRLQCVGSKDPRRARRLRGIESPDDAAPREVVWQARDPPRRARLAGREPMPARHAARPACVSVVRPSTFRTRTRWMPAVLRPAAGPWFDRPIPPSLVPELPGLLVRRWRCRDILQVKFCPAPPWLDRVTIAALRTILSAMRRVRAVCPDENR